MIEQAEVRREYVAPSVEVGPQAFAFTIGDDRNEGKLELGEVIVLDPSVTPGRGDFVMAASVDNREVAIGVYIPFDRSNPEYPGFSARPYNPAYDDPVRQIEPGLGAGNDR